ncbi:MAG: formimidoylglutamase, partial [Bdellovibrionales bacterium]
MSDFLATDRKLFFSKNDPLDPRLGDLVKTKSEGADVAILGYPDEEGIRLNGGREGASQGPREIRHWLYRTTPHPRRPLKSFADLGDLDVTSNINQRHENALKMGRDLLAKNLQLLTFGGGNDYAYCDGMAFLETFKGKKPLIINIDAHLDVRDLTHGLTSGTPFFRLLESDVRFEFIELGAQSQCNSDHHWDYVEKKGGRIISFDEILESGLPLTECVLGLLGDSLLRRRPAYLSIDIDAMAMPYATGSSASWPIGFHPQPLWSLLQVLMKRLDVRVFGIYEVSPPLDIASGT